MDSFGDLLTFFSVLITPFSVGFFPHASAPDSTPMAMGWISIHFRLLMDLSIPCYWFDLLVGFYFSARFFFWGPPFRCSASTTLWNVDRDSSKLLSIIWNLIVSLLSSPRTLFFSWEMTLSITVHYTQELRRFSTSGNKVAKLADNEVVSKGYWYS